MIRTKLRIRISENRISEELAEAIESDTDLQKQIFRLDREQVMNCLLRDNYLFPLKIDNVIFLINHIFIKQHKVTSITLPELVENFRIRSGP